MAAAAASLQSCPTLCNPIDSSPPGSQPTVPGILQARILEWVAIAFSNAWKWKVKVKSFSRAQPLATPWTAAHQAPPSTGFSRQEYWSGLPLPSPPRPVGDCQVKTPACWDFFGSPVTKIPCSQCRWQQGWGGWGSWVWSLVRELEPTCRK